MRQHASVNRIYRLVWNELTGAWIAVAETSRRRGKRSSRRLAALLLSVGAVAAHAGPTGGQITAGSGQIHQHGHTTAIQQNSQNLSLSWQSFNVGAQETVDFIQPNANSIAVNRIAGSSGSQILGHLNANGQVWLINPNGVLFGRYAQVNVAGLVASTLNADDASLNAGSIAFSGSGSGSVVNQGTLAVSKGGYVVLLGNSASNQGVISAQLGSVALAGGSAATLTFSHNRLLQVQVDQSTLGSLASNNGLLVADGGTVLMTAGARSTLLASSVNNTGVLRANSIEKHNGTIELLAGGAAGQVNVGGTVQVSASDGTGGAVTATASEVTVAPGANIDASGSRGGGAIDIGGGWGGGGGIAQATTVIVADGATLNASATNSGHGGEIVVRSDVDNPDSTTRAYGTFIASGGAAGGDGGRIETSGHWLDVSGSSVNTSAPHGDAGVWLLDPQNVTIAASGTAISGSGTISYVPTATSTITASSITSALQSGTNVTITTGTTGGSLGDITVSSAIGKVSGNTDVTLTLQAADSVIVNAPISNTGGTGKLNVNLYADNDNGTHDGVGVVILNSSISTGGGSLSFGTGSTMTINGVANTLVGGDVYVGGSSAINLTTTGGNAAIRGQLIIANSSGLNIDTTNGSSAGNVVFSGLVDSGDSYALVNTSLTWTQALAAAKSGVGASVGDTYLATITSRLENAVAGYTAGYAASWLGGERVVGLGTDAVWRWVAGPEGLSNGGLGLPFFTQNGSATVNGNGGTAINSAYTNWNSGEPNNYQGANLSASGRQEWAMQFVGTQGQWNDLTGTGTSLPYLTETNLAPSPLNVNAGTAGTVTFAAGLGQNKPLLTLGVTGQIILLNNASTNITTTGAETLTGQVQLNGSNVNVLTVTAPSVITSYGATLPTLTPTYSGFLNGDTVASLSSLAVATTTGTTSAVSTAPITVSGAVDSNYLILYDPGTLLVNPATLTVALTHVATKTYDGTLSATLSGGTLVGVVSSDLGNVTLSQSGSFVSKNAGPNVGVTVTDSVSGSAIGNYVLQEPSGVTGAINQLGITVAGSTVSNKVYNGSNAATLSGGALVGVLAGDVSTVNLTQSGTFSSKNVGPSIAVTASDALTGAGAVNYSLTQPSGLTGSITSLGLTVSGSSAGSKTYDGTLTAPVSGGSLVGVLAGDVSSVNLTQSGTFSSKNVGPSIAVTASDALTGSGAVNYSLTQPSGLTGSITSLGLTVSGSSVGSKTYDGTLTAPVSGGSLVGVLAGDVSSVNLTQSGTFSSKNVGPSIAVTASDALTGSGAVNYSLAQPSGLTGAITPLGLTVSGSSAGSKTYDGTLTAPVSGGSLVGVLAGDVSSVNLTQSGTFSSKNVGPSIAVTASDALIGAAAGNYSLTQPGGLTGAITSLGLTVSGTSAGSKTYDGTLTAPVSGGSLVGVVAGDVGSVSLSQSGTFSSKNVGPSIAVTASDALTGAGAGNYSLTQPGGLTGAITPLGLTVSGSSAGSKTYDGTLTAPVSGGSLVGVLPSDTGSVNLSQSGIFSSANVGANLAVSASDALTGAAAGNYSLTQPNGLSGNIDPAHLTLAGAPTTATKTYDGTIAASTSGGTLIGLIAGDADGVALMTHFASANAGQNISVIPTLSGTKAGNYVIDSTNGSLSGDINPAPLLATADPIQLTVGSALPSLSGTFSGFVSGQTFASLIVAGYQASWTNSAGSSLAAGHYPIVGSFTDGNYSVIQASGNAVALTAAAAAPSNATSAGLLLPPPVSANPLSSPIPVAPSTGLPVSVADPTATSAPVSASVQTSTILPDSANADSGASAEPGASAPTYASVATAAGGPDQSTNVGSSLLAVTASGSGTIAANNVTPDAGASTSVAAVSTVSEVNAGAGSKGGAGASRLSASSPGMLSQLGGRRLLVLSGGVNTNAASEPLPAAGPL